MDKLPVGQLPDLQQSNNDDEIMVITNSEYNQLKKEKISDLITDFTSTNENNALTKGTDGKLFVTDFGNASNITEGTLPVSVLPDIPKDLLPAIETTDLPNSGVTADTYAYPSSVTVNAQGQVTAIEEGTPSGANADTDLSNLTDEGEKHFLNKTQVTNCILEEPDNTIIYEYNDSSFTFKAGSIAIFPYGTSAPAKSIGDDLFNNGHWIITDIQYDSGKLFYWARKQNDLTLTSWSASALSGDSKACYGQDNGIYSFLNTYSGTSIPEGAVTGMFYNTNDNRVYRIYNGSIEEYQSNYYSFPFMILHFDNSTLPKSVKQLFKGQGYIGATRWINKGVKLLFPNGRNSDGTLNNIEAVSKLLILSNVNNSSGYTANYKSYLLFSYNSSSQNIVSASYISIDRYFETDNLDEIPQEERNAIVYRPSFNDFWWYNASEDKWYERIYCITGEMYYNYSTASKILEFKPKNTFRAVDYNDFYELQNNSANKDLTNLTNGLANVICTTAPTTTSTASSQNPAVVIENYVNGASGYRVWSDRYCEQWGYAESVNKSATITLPLAMSNGNYNIICTGTEAQGGGDNGSMNAYNVSATGFNIYNTSDVVSNAYWHVFGYRK